ncbi:transcription factor IBH1-like [Panicum miliaceum]|uniref:Transcription factor IBH1-like n=1 Tax=Panicum miliaceum TaxID=4540 RepID=A0A3L6RRT1_PANMI|nr:transcription factor IBH1-like [Panicum miliaceum]
MPPGSKRFRHAILKNLLLGLRKGGAAASRGMGLHERRSAIRRAADAALATARGAAPRWNRSLAAELSQGGRDAHLTIRPAKSAPSSSECKSPGMTVCSKRIPRRRRLRARPKSRATAKAAGVLARVLVRKRARALREIVPGGRGMDECTLLGETLDYAVSLKAQVEAMQLLLRTLQAPKNPSTLLRP